MTIPTKPLSASQLRALFEKAAADAGVENHRDFINVWTTPTKKEEGSK